MDSPAHGFNGGLTCALECNDLETSLAWYQNVLGFELLLKEESMAWAEFRTPIEGVTLGIAQVEEAQTKGGATLTWGVVSVDQTRAQIEKHDVRFEAKLKPYQVLFVWQLFLIQTETDTCSTKIFKDKKGHNNAT